MTSTPVYHSAVLAKSKRPHVFTPTEYGNLASFWVEYPSGLVDLTRTAHLPNQRDSPDKDHDHAHKYDVQPPPLVRETQFQVSVECDRVLRLDRAHTAIVIVDMQNYFLHPDLREHPTGLDCVVPLMNTVISLRALGVKVIWCNWGLADHELTTIPPSLVRGFMKNGRGGFGTDLPEPFGRLLMRDQFNSQLYGPLQHMYEQGKAEGTDVWIHKNRMSGLWGPQTALDLYLQEEGFSTLFFAGVNADQCVLGTIVDSYYRGYDCVVLSDCIATNSPTGGYENVLYNSMNSYGFVTDSTRVMAAADADADRTQNGA